MADVTLYEELLTLFQRFAEQGRQAHPEATVIDIWRKTLNADDDIAFRVLMVLRANLKRSIDQINSSEILDPEDKYTAVTTMQALDEVINPGIAQRKFSELAEYVTQRKIAMLMLLSNALQPEYKEPTVAARKTSKISGKINELAGSVRGSNYLNTVLRNRLLSYLSYMDFAVRNIELTGIEAVYTAFGPALLFLRQHAASTNGSGDGEIAKEAYQTVESLFEELIECREPRS